MKLLDRLTLRIGRRVLWSAYQKAGTAPQQAFNVFALAEFAVAMPLRSVANLTGRI